LDIFLDLSQKKKKKTNTGQPERGHTSFTTEERDCHF